MALRVVRAQGQLIIIYLTTLQRGPILMPGRDGPRPVFRHLFLSFSLFRLCRRQRLDLLAMAGKLGGIFVDVLVSGPMLTWRWMR